MVRWTTVLVAFGALACSGTGASDAARADSTRGSLTDGASIDSGGIPDADVPPDVGPTPDTAPTPDPGAPQDIPVDTAAADVPSPTDSAEAEADLPDAGPPEPVTLVGAGWSFGLCAGPCVGALERADAAVTYRIDGPGNQLYLNNAGTLTATGLAEVASIEAALAGVPLDPVTGCPDCNDGGAATIRLARGETVSTYTYGFGNPPAALAPADAFAAAVMDALKTCTPHGWVLPHDACIPYSDAPLSTSRVLGGGWSFGFCAGKCFSAVALEGNAVRFEVRAAADGEVLGESTGLLTVNGAQKSVALAEALVDVTLAAVTGCPDCNDGGMSWVTLRRNDVVSDHTYEFGQPPEVLTATDAFVQGLLTALQNCTITSDVVVDAGCVPSL